MKQNEITAEDALGFHIRPLYDRRRKVALLISAKSACTTMVKWFFHHTGHLKAAQDFDRWIHHYRLRVYYKSDEYQQHVKDLLSGEYTIVKVVRNPFDRAVSSFIHGMKHNLEQRQMHRVLSKRGSLHPGRLFERRRERGQFTFREFVHFLERVDLNRGNVHFRTQWHPLEKFLPVTHVIRMEEISSGIRDVENRLGWEPTDIKSFSSSVHHTHRSKQREVNAMDKRFELFGRDDTVVPSCTDFFDRQLVARVAKIYAIDFQTYGYDSSPAELTDSGLDICSRAKSGQRKAA